MPTEQEEHNAGQRDGVNATFLDELVVTWNPLLSESYRKGFRNGLTNRRKEPRAQTSFSSKEANDSWLVGSVQALGIGVITVVVALPLALFYALVKRPVASLAIVAWIILLIAASYQPPETKAVPATLLLLFPTLTFAVGVT